MLNEMTRDRFVDYLNTPFRLLDVPLLGLALTLAQVSELHTGQGYESFSLFFQGSAAWPLQQRIYQLEHDQLGKMELFLVPVGSDKEVLYYEAVFNRLI